MLLKKANTIIYNVAVEDQLKELICQKGLMMLE